MNIALLTCEHKYSNNNEKSLEEALTAKGYAYQWVNWNDANIDWSDFDKVVIRTTWDYQSQLENFLSVLERIDKSKAELINPISTVKWNIDKNYLFELEENDIEIVPTKIVEDIDEDYFSILGETLVFKPTVSASAHNTYKVDRAEFQNKKEEISKVMEYKTIIVQPFLPAIQTEGEYSLLYFKGELSHAVLKTPQEGDFRSQPEYGSYVRKVNPPQEVLTQASKVVSFIGKELLYCRVDLVKHQGVYCLMEVELIEPYLYFEHDEKSGCRIVEGL